MFSFHKLSFSHVVQNRCSWKFHNIHRKTPVLESLLLKRDYFGIFKNTFFTPSWVFRDSFHGGGGEDEITPSPPLSCLNSLELC